VVSDLFAFWCRTPPALPRQYQEKQKKTPCREFICDSSLGMTDNFIFEQHEKHCADYLSSARRMSVRLGQSANSFPSRHRRQHIKTISSVPAAPLDRECAHRSMLGAASSSVAA